MAELTNKQQRFIREYLVDLNATQAAIRAGYSKDTARSIGCENLTKPDIAAAIYDKLQKEDITRNRIVDELANIGFSNAGEFFKWGPDGIEIKDSDELTEEQQACISEVSQTKNAQGGGSIKVKLHDKQAALEKLGRVLCMFKDRIEHTGEGGTPLVPVLNVYTGDQPEPAPEAGEGAGHDGD